MEADKETSLSLHSRDSFEYRALYNLRRSSQVCRLWRNVILENPTFWANVIEVELLAQETGYWRSEVLRRTGTVLLFVKGHILEQEETKSLDWLLQTHWPRLRKLDIRLNSRSWSWVNKSTWEVLGHPTNYLEFFNFSLIPETVATSSPVRQGSKPFSNHAPALREFHSSQITFSLQAPWLQQVTHITFSAPTFTVSQILSALEYMPLLEAFDVRSTVLPFRSPIPLNALEPKVNLPRLNYITICHKLTTSLAMLGQMTPAPGCCLHLRTTDTERNGMTVPVMNLMHSVISRYSRNYFDHTQHDVPKLSIDLTRYNFRLLGLLSESRTVSQGFDIDLFHGGVPPAWASVFLAVILRCNLDRVSVLELCGMVGLSPDDPDLTNFLHKFNLVKDLRVFSPDILEFIPQVASWHEAEVVFPSLETVRLIGWKKVELEPTLSFLKWRQKLGVLNLKDLHISQNNARASVRGDLRDLEQIGGLSITWTGKGGEGNYVCGSGNPDLLNF